MASLFEIGKSAVNAQRQALNVTGQNIANVNTDGYRKRDASLKEVSGSQSELTSISTQVGLGVSLGAIGEKEQACLTLDEVGSRFENIERTLLVEIVKAKNLLNCDQPR